MDLSALTISSNPIYLRDISPDFAAYEGEVERDKAVWVKVRQATEGDNIKRSELRAERQVRYESPGSGEPIMSETMKDNPQQRFVHEAYWTIEEVGNLVRDGQPVFRKMPVSGLPFSTFEKIWMDFPPILARALHMAVRIINPDWDWEGLSSKYGDKSGEA